ncbi:hypothetical protein [Corynebacterium phoceense]|uniref:hypothetical protein n=1 Tax=Corynebacterium phoceense TaxID=1686286 RepID=UPI001DE5833A|nr:hypothetical protein [Corynebacterium phoceense]HJG43110.1 hypothetical protein [Corynebacterium phoceense]
MMVIKVDEKTHATLQELVESSGRTVSGLVEDLAQHERERRAAVEEERKLMEQAREAIRRNPPDDEYWAEFRDWQSGRWN